jgi:osmoprotectant transport system permease protein
MAEFLGDLVAWFVENWNGPPAEAIPTGWNLGYVNRIWEHVWVSGWSVLTAMAIALPMASWLGHTKRGGLVAVSLVNIGRALPSFGIVALALPITIRIARNVPFIESGLGFLPTYIALVALALPPIFTNTYTGIRSVDPEVVESARGMGIRGPQILATVELPLASPVILAGIRTSTVQVVATATLGALVSYGGLGRYIIDGFALRDDVQIVAGALLVAALSIVTELAFSVAERWLVPAPLRRIAAAATDTEVREPVEVPR